MFAGSLFSQWAALVCLCHFHLDGAVGIVFCMSVHVPCLVFHEWMHVLSDNMRCSFFFTQIKDSRWCDWPEQFGEKRKRNFLWFKLRPDQSVQHLLTHNKIMPSCSFTILWLYIHKVFKELDKGRTRIQTKNNLASPLNSERYFQLKLDPDKESKAPATGKGRRESVSERQSLIVFYLCKKWESQNYEMSPVTLFFQVKVFCYSS